MGERTSYQPGTFCWTDLGTTDAADSKRFYTELFGWDYEDIDAGDAGIYTMLLKNGKQVCALYEQSGDRLVAGWSPTWVSYVSVESADAAAEAALSLGGSVTSDPIDVVDSGRMTLLTDPTGAPFAAWEPRAHFGAGLVNDVGSMCWNELNTSDPRTAVDFYTKLFGWTTEQPSPDFEYHMIKNGEQSNGGITNMNASEGTPNWLVYFTVDNTDSATDVADRLGGNVLVTPMDVPQGRISVIQDPQGAPFCLFQGEVQD